MCQENEINTKRAWKFIGLLALSGVIAGLVLRFNTAQATESTPVMYPKTVNGYYATVACVYGHAFFVVNDKAVQIMVGPNTYKDFPNHPMQCKN